MSDPVPKASKPKPRVSASLLIILTNIVKQTCTGLHCGCKIECDCEPCKTCESTIQSDYFVPEHKHPTPPPCSSEFPWICGFDDDDLPYLLVDDATKLERIREFYETNYKTTRRLGTMTKLTKKYAEKNTKYDFIEKDGIIIGADIIVPFRFSNRHGLTPNQIWNYEFLKQLVRSVESSGLRFLSSDPIKERNFRIDTTYNFWKE
jgi:hypothetical protein